MLSLVFMAPCLSWDCREEVNHLKAWLGLKDPLSKCFTHKAVNWNFPHDPRASLSENDWSKERVRHKPQWLLWLSLRSDISSLLLQPIGHSVQLWNNVRGHYTREHQKTRSLWQLSGAWLPYLCFNQIVFLWSCKNFFIFSV